MSARVGPEVTEARMNSGTGEILAKALDGERITDADALTLLCAVTVSVWEAGGAPPGAALNDNAVELNVRGSAVPDVTVRVTPQLSEPTFEFTVTVVVYVPAARLARPAGTRASVRVVGTEGLLRVADNQLGIPLDKETATPAGSPIG